MCPAEEFLPRPPDPEDIIYCDDENKKQSAGEAFTEDISETVEDLTERANEKAPVETLNTSLSDNVTPASSAVVSDNTNTDTVGGAEVTSSSTNIC